MCDCALHSLLTSVNNSNILEELHRMSGHTFGGIDWYKSIL